MSAAGSDSVLALKSSYNYVFSTVPVNLIQDENAVAQANCQCIMSHESGGNANAMHENSDGSVDVGLWQINDYNWDYCSNGAAPCDPSQNLACAMDVYMWGDNTWKFWVTCSTCGCCDSP